MFEVGQRVVRTESWDQQGIFAGDEGTVVDVSGLGRSVPVIRVKFDGKGIRTVLASKMESSSFPKPPPAVWLDPEVLRSLLEPPIVKECPVPRERLAIVDIGPDLGMFIRDGMTSKQARAALERGIPIGFDKALDALLKRLPKTRASVPGPKSIRVHAAPEHAGWVKHLQPNADPLMIWGR